MAEVFRQPDLAATQVLISVGGMLLGGMVPMMFTLLGEFPDVRPDYIGGVAGMTGAVSNLGGILLPLVVVAPNVTAGGAGAYSLAFMIVVIIALCALPAALLIKETYGVRVPTAPDRSPDVMP